MGADERERLLADRAEAEGRSRNLFSLLQASEAECAALREAVGVLEEGRRRLEAQNAALREDLRALETVEDERDHYPAGLRDVGRLVGCDHPSDGHARCVRKALDRLRAERDALLAACRELSLWRQQKKQGASLVKAVELAEGALAMCEGRQP